MASQGYPIVNLEPVEVGIKTHYIIIHCEIQSPNPKSEEADATLRNSRVKRIIYLS